MKIETTATLNLTGFEALRKGLQPGECVKVGVFGDHKNERKKGDGITNLELAWIMIFGSISRRIPARDFIKMPIQEKRKEILAYAASKPMRELLLRGEKKKALKLLGVFSENMIQKAFDTGGFGKWAKLSWYTIQAKGSSKILINFGELRRAVWSRVSGL